jgi:bud emergence protein 1
VPAPALQSPPACLAILTFDVPVPPLHERGQGHPPTTTHIHTPQGRHRHSAPQKGSSSPSLLHRCCRALLPRASPSPALRALAHPAPCFFQSSLCPRAKLTGDPISQVIKAIYDYTPTDTSPSSVYLSFSQGDFLHVVGRENDSDWYEACNPLHNTRGLVPVSYFEDIGKTVRDSGGSAPRFSAPSQPHDSGYQERLQGITSPNNPNGLAGIPNMMAQQMRMSQSGKTGAMVYGIVMYDFKAERPDELEAKEGEAIIVIAQSNPEWFVAKPITRLGGPGLIPVSFIEIRDMTTGKAVPDAQQAVASAGVPKVEEWKKMAADYKNGSIPLGKLETNSQQTLQAGMERMSLSGKSLNGGSVSLTLFMFPILN